MDEGVSHLRLVSLRYATNFLVMRIPNGDRRILRVDGKFRLARGAGPLVVSLPLRASFSQA